MKKKFSLQYVFLLMIVYTSQAQDLDYKYSRPVIDVSDEWHVFTLPQDVLNHTEESMNDIRIMGQDSLGNPTRIPFFLTSLKRDEVINNEQLNVFNESTKDSVFVYVAEMSNRRKVDEIELSIGNHDFDGRVKLEGKEGSEWFTIVDNYRIFSFANSDVNYKFTKVRFPESDYSQYRVSISNIHEPVLNSVYVANRIVDSGSYYNVGAELQLENGKGKDNVSQFRIRLDSLSRFSELSFVIKDKIDYYRKVEIRELQDSIESRKGWKYLYRTIYKGTLASYENHTIQFNEKIATELQMRVYNRDNQPLTIESVNVRTPKYELTARFDKGPNFLMHYGNPAARKPAFDIERFKNSIPSGLEYLRLGSVTVQENGMEENSNFFIPKTVLYAIMALIILVIGWFTVKMLS